MLGKQTTQQTALPNGNAQGKLKIKNPEDFRAANFGM
jgi:hypothetical protein